MFPSIDTLVTELPADERDERDIARPEEVTRIASAAEVFGRPQVQAQTPDAVTEKQPARQRPVIPAQTVVHQPARDLLEASAKTVIHPPAQPAQVGFAPMEEDEDFATLCWDEADLLSHGLVTEAQEQAELFPERLQASQRSECSERHRAEQAAEREAMRAAAEAEAVALAALNAAEEVFANMSIDVPVEPGRISRGTEPPPAAISGAFRAAFHARPLNLPEPLPSVMMAEGTRDPDGPSALPDFVRTGAVALPKNEVRGKARGDKPFALCHTLVTIPPEQQRMSPYAGAPACDPRTAAAVAAASERQERRGGFFAWIRRMLG